MEISPDRPALIHNDTKKAGNMAKLSLYTKDYVVFDLETTGLSPGKDEIIEISGIKVQDGKAMAEYSTLVHPGCPIPCEATNINGITDEMVQDAPKLKEALENFLTFAGNAVLVGHNIHSFDMKFLQAGAGRELNRTLSNDYVDTLYLARTLLPLTRFRLTDVASYFHLETEGAHRALNDCRMNYQCYEAMGKLCQKLSEAGTAGQMTTVCPKCGSLLVRRKGKYGEFWGCGSFPKCRYTQS